MQGLQQIFYKIIDILQIYQSEQNKKNQNNSPELYFDQQCYSIRFNIFSQNIWNIKTYMIATILFTLLAKSISYKSNNCFDGCQTCEIISSKVYCTSCFPNRIYNYTSGLCDCNSSSFEFNGRCVSCPSYCQTCNISRCTSCSSDRFLDTSGICLCTNGKNFDSLGNCEMSDSNIRLVLGIGIGCTLGFIIIIILACRIKKRNIQLYDQRLQSTNITQHQQNQALPVIVIEVLRENQNISGHSILVTSKKYQFKDEMCSICLEDSPFFSTQCGHYFHQHCIMTWIKKRDHCPNCNTTISAEKIMKWCSICKKQPIFPYFYHIVSPLRQNHKFQVPVFWPTCSNCQIIEQNMDLNGPKGRNNK